MKLQCKTLALCGALFASSLALSTGAQAKEPASPMQLKALLDANFDRLFMIHVAQGNMAEVMTGQLALKKSKNPAVRMVASTTIKGHGDAQKELLEHFKHLKLMAPTDPGVDNKATYAMLSKLSGPAFDKAYIAAQVGAHETTVVLFENEIANGKIPMIQDFAKKVLPGILMHTSMIYDAGAMVKAPGGNLRPKSFMDATKGAAMMKMKM